MLNRIQEHLDEIQKFESESIDDVEQFRIKYLGKKGLLNHLFEAFKDVPNQDKKAELMSLLDKQTQFKQQLEEEEMAWLDAQEQIELKREEYDNANA